MEAPAVHVTMFRALVDQLPAPVLLVGSGRRIIYRNPAALRAIGEEGTRCCDVVCGDDCLTRSVLRGEGVVQRELPRPGAGLWTATVSRLPDMEAVSFFLHGAPALAGDDAPPLRIRALGRTRLEVGDRLVTDGWLAHRPGHVLKYLIAARRRVVTVDELVEALWPTGGSAATASVRQAVHTLRLHLEPGRPRGAGAGYVTSHRGGYSLDPDRVRVDADDFERLATSGLAAADHGDLEHASTMLGAAIAQYEGDFLEDEPFAEWALAERDRLRSLVAWALRTLARVETKRGDLQAANERLEQLAEMEPLDMGTQRELLRVMLERGRHSDAARRYELVRHRYRRAFGQDPGFGLAELASSQ